MSRHPEGYHIQIQEAAATNMLMTPEDDRNQFEGEPIRAKEKGLEKHIHIDWHRRGLFVDHFLGDTADLHNFETTRYPEQGDFTDNPYKATYEHSDDHVAITLSRDGNVWLGDVHVPVTVTKRIWLERDASTVKATYTVENQGGIHLHTRFGVETAMGLDGGNNREHHYLRASEEWHGLGEIGGFDKLEEYELVSERHGFHVGVRLSEPGYLWHFPLAPITLSEGGFERVHQGMVLLQWWYLSLEPGSAWTTEITIDIGPHTKAR
jgi:alpha-amylase